LLSLYSSFDFIDCGFVFFYLPFLNSFLFWDLFSNIARKFSTRDDISMNLIPSCLLKFNLINLISWEFLGFPLLFILYNILYFFSIWESLSPISKLSFSIFAGGFLDRLSHFYCGPIFFPEICSSYLYSFWIWVENILYLSFLFERLTLRSRTWSRMLGRFPRPLLSYATVYVFSFLLLLLTEQTSESHFVNSELDQGFFFLESFFHIKKSEPLLKDIYRWGLKFSIFFLSKILL